MGYDLIIYRTKEPEIQIQDNKIQAHEVLYMHKPYWLGNAMQKHGTDHDEHFIHLTPEALEAITLKVKECLTHKGDHYYIRKNFHTGYLTSYEEMVIYPQMAYFNQVMCNLLRNKREKHYWYLKYG